MSITGTLLVASGAMETYGSSLAVTGDDIADLNAVGYRESRYTFADLMPTFDGSIKMGGGVRLADVTKPFQQGSLETTSNPWIWRFPATDFLSCATY